MEQEEQLRKLDEFERKIDLIYDSVEKLRKYFLWTLIISIGAIVLPLIGLILIAPWFISTMLSAYTIS